MVNQTILIALIVGIFFAGLGMGYVAFYSTQPNFMHMTPQQMQQMMNNPQMMTQWHQTMMSNPQAMNQWMNMMTQNPNMMNQWMGSMMNNPTMMNNMMGTMMQNQQFGNWMMGNMMNNPTMMNNMMGPMMNDPQFSQQMYGMMFQNQQFMQNMMNNTQFQNQWMMNPNMMGGNMMGSGMMNYGMMGSMMGTPITKQSDVITTINKIESILDQVSASYKSGDKDTAFSQATSAYLENYEYIESAISAKDLKQMEKIENMLRVELRSMIQNEDPIEDIDAKIDSIKENLDNVKLLFQ
jgi:hypothetical protein